MEKVKRIRRKSFSKDADLKNPVPQKPHHRLNTVATYCPCSVPKAVTIMLLWHILGKKRYIFYFFKFKMDKTGL